jgi:VanZ family protein
MFKQFRYVLHMPLWRVISTLLCVILVFNLFYIGAKPVAVGLFQPPLDKVAHFCTFALITLLLWIGLLRRRPWLLIGIASAVGAVDEIHQIFLPGRSAGFDDFATDVLAVVVTTLVLMWQSVRVNPP